VGNIPLPSWYAEVEYYTPKNPVYLLKGSASVTVQFSQTRLDVRVRSNTEIHLLITVLVE
jgi:hypothetical protein